MYNTSCPVYGVLPNPLTLFILNVCEVSTCLQLVWSSVLVTVCVRCPPVYSLCGHPVLLSSSSLSSPSPHSQAYSLVMGMLWKRLNDHGKNWRHVYKVLHVHTYMYMYTQQRPEKKIYIHVALLVDA